MVLVNRNQRFLGYCDSDWEGIGEGRSGIGIGRFFHDLHAIAGRASVRCTWLYWNCLDRNSVIRDFRITAASRKVVRDMGRYSFLQ